MTTLELSQRTDAAPWPRFQAVAPTLAKGWLAQRRFLLHRSNELLRLRRLVAHRELQLVRAQARGKGRYIAERQRKLEQAQRWLRAVEESR